VAVVQMHRPLEKILREKAQVNRLAEYFFWRGFRKCPSAVTALAGLPLNVLLPDCAALCEV
jgi:hypothetical protein